LVLRHGVADVIRFEAKVIQKLGCQWPVRLEVPSFIKDGVVALFDSACVKINVAYVVIRRSVTGEYTWEVMPVKFTTAVAASFDTDAWPEDFERHRSGFCP
jgi:hypothetical protein